MKLIAVCSGKGGTGKSCVAAYTAIALGAMRKKTLLIETGPAPGTLDLILNVQEQVVFNLWDVLQEKCAPKKAVIKATEYENVSLLPTGLAPKSELKMGLSQLIAALKNDYDFIIIDSLEFAPINPREVQTILMVATPDTLSVRAASQKCRELYELGANNLRLVINNVPSRVLPMQNAKDFDDIIDVVGAQLIAVIPQSQRLCYGANNGKPVSEESITVAIFERLAARIRGKQEPLLIR